MKTHTLTKMVVSLVLTAASTLASTARAATAPDEEIAATGAPAAGAVATDPNIDRGFLLPTAMTQPAGSVTYNNYELLLHGVTYGITDNVQVSLTVLSPIVREMPLVGFGSIKARVLSASRFHLAVQGSAGFGHSFENDADPNAYTVGAGGFGSLCLRDDCSSLLSASATYQLATTGGTDGVNRTHMVIYGGSIVHRVGRHVKLLGEVTSMAGRGQDTDFVNLSGALASYGVRFHTADIAADLGFVKPVGTDPADDPFLMGFPYANVSYRW